MLNRSSSVAVSNASLFPRSSNPTSLCLIVSIAVGGQNLIMVDLSLDTPSMKHITQGRILIPSFSTSQGTFSTNTRKNRVVKYFGANFCSRTFRQKTTARVCTGTHSEVFIHDLASFEICVVEMDYTTGFASVGFISTFFWRARYIDSRTHSHNLLLIRDLTVTPVCALLHLLHTFHSRHSQSNKSIPNRNTSLSSERFQPLFSHHRVAVILNLFLEHSEQCILVFPFWFVVTGVVGFDKSSGQRGDFRIDAKS